MVRRTSLAFVAVLWLAGLSLARAAPAHGGGKTLMWELFSGKRARVTFDYTSVAVSEARSARFSGYGLYVRHGIGQVRALVQTMRDGIQPLTQADLVEAIAALVQSIEYEPRKGRHMPLDTLDLWKGDCEDKSILAAALLEAAGIRTVLLVFPKARHMTVAAALARDGEWVLERDGARYTVIECTGYGWRPGRLPPDLEGQQVKVVRIPADLSRDAAPRPAAAPGVGMAADRAAAAAPGSKPRSDATPRDADQPQQTPDTQGAPPQS